LPSSEAVRVSGTTHVELGDPIRLVCNVSAGLIADWNDRLTGNPSPPIDADWYRTAGTTAAGAAAAIRSSRRSGITVSKKVDVHRVGDGADGQLQYLVVILEVEASRAEHAGDYVCRSTSGETESMSVYLHNGRPQDQTMVVNNA
jgi:hypothetical protein